LSSGANASDPLVYGLGGAFLTIVALAAS
jgi:hypothetical protein